MFFYSAVKTVQIFYSAKKTWNFHCNLSKMNCGQWTVNFCKT